MAKRVANSDSPYEITGLELHEINDVLRRIGFRLDQLFGFQGDAEVSIAPHSHGSSSSGGTGGVISHNDLTNVTSDQHHDKIHTHNGSDGSGEVDWDDILNKPTETDDLEEAQHTTMPWEYILPGTGITVTIEGEDGTAVRIAATGGGSGHTIQDEGVDLTARTNLNFVGDGVVVTDDAGNDASVVTISSSAAEATDVGLEEPTTRIAERVFVSGAIELAEWAEGDYITLRGLEPLTNGNATTPELIFADGEVVMA